LQKQRLVQRIRLLSPTSCVVIPEFAQQMSGIQNARQNKEVRVPVFASGETGVTTN
jgi:hypothetical protein